MLCGRIQIYLLDPTCPKNNSQRLIEQLKQTQDKQHREFLRRILDLWGDLTIDVIKLTPFSDRTKSHYFVCYRLQQHLSKFILRQ
jgi:hypothetical protein